MSSIQWVLWIIIIKTCSTIICTTGHCTFDCSQQNCKEIICTDTADSCSIDCGASDCAESIFYLAATVNTISCDGADSCKSSQFYCGVPDMIPFGFSETNFDAHINSCVFTLTNNAMPDSGLISCAHDIDFCLVETQSDNDDFKESTFQCHLSPIHARCILDCYNEKSCGSTTSRFMCDAANCQCINYDNNPCDEHLYQDMIHTETTLNPTTNNRISTQTINDDIVLSLSLSTSISPTIAPTVYNKISKIVAIAPTQPQSGQIHIFSTLIRKERPIQSTEINANNATNDISSISLIIHNALLGGAISCVLIIICVCSVVVCRKMRKQRKESNIKQQHKEEKEAEDHKSSTIDLTPIHMDMETNMMDYEGESDVMDVMDVLYDINLNETSDDETADGDECLFDTISNAVAALCSIPTTQTATDAKVYDIDHKNDSFGTDKFVISWNSADDELEDMYDVDAHEYSKTTPFLPPSMNEDSVISTPSLQHSTSLSQTIS